MCGCNYLFVMSGCFDSGVLGDVVLSVVYTGPTVSL